MSFKIGEVVRVFDDREIDDAPFDFKGRAPLGEIVEINENTGIISVLVPDVSSGVTKTVTSLDYIVMDANMDNSKSLEDLIDLNKNNDLTDDFLNTNLFES